MELTQIHGDNPWQKINLNNQNQVGIWSWQWNTITNNQLPWNAAQISQWNDWNQVINPIKQTPVFVNNKQISWTSPISHWDTIAVWSDKNVVMWVHKPGENLNPQQVSWSLANMNFSSWQIAEITNRLFDIKYNKPIQKPLLMLIWVLVFLLGLIWYSFIKLSNINDALLKRASNLESKITLAQSTLSDVEWILWISLVPEEDEECDPDYEDCSWGGSNGSTIDSRISKLNDEVESIDDKVKNISKESSKIEKEVLDALDSALKWEWSEVIKKAIIEKIEETSLQEQTDKIDKLSKNFALLDKALWDEVEKMLKDIEGILDYKDDIAALKEVRKFMTEYQNLNAVTEKKFKLIETDSVDNTKEIKSLKQKDDDLDSLIKKINEEINSLELQIKNLSK